LIGTTLETVFTNLAEGALLVTVVLYIFLGNLRSAAIVAVIGFLPAALSHGIGAEIQRPLPALSSAA